MKEFRHTIQPSEECVECKEGLFWTVFLQDDDSLPVFLAQGGAGDPEQFFRFLLTRDTTLEPSAAASFFSIQAPKGGCSVCSVTAQGGGYLFGRNFDFRRCNMVIVKAKPRTGYASISTVNSDFTGTRPGIKFPDPRLENLFRLLLYYLPMDGMNERGLCVSINNIRDQVNIHQSQKGKTNQTVNTLVRTLLDCAADVDEALAILYITNFHTVDGYLTHLIIADAKGQCVCAEYLNNQLYISDARVVTNHYLTPGEKFGIGTKQSHLRFQTLQRIIQENNGFFEPDGLKQALTSVAKSNYPADGERFTEWSVIYDQWNRSACYFRRENFENGYVLTLGSD